MRSFGSQLSAMSRSHIDSAYATWRRSQCATWRRGSQCATWWRREEDLGVSCPRGNEREYRQPLTRVDGRARPGVEQRVRGAIKLRRRAEQQRRLLRHRSWDCLNARARVEKRADDRELVVAEGEGEVEGLPAACAAVLDVRARREQRAHLG